eukprot:scaffold15261_cov89-Skeletonema_dohrnii-CCMP3373.AAC.2
MQLKSSLASNVIDVRSFTYLPRVSIVVSHHCKYADTRLKKSAINTASFVHYLLSSHKSYEARTRTSTVHRGEYKRGKR